MSWRFHPGFTRTSRTERRPTADLPDGTCLLVEWETVFALQGRDYPWDERWKCAVAIVKDGYGWSPDSNNTSSVWVSDPTWLVHILPDDPEYYLVDQWRMLRAMGVADADDGYAHLEVFEPVWQAIREHWPVSSGQQS